MARRKNRHVDPDVENEEEEHEDEGPVSQAPRERAITEQPSDSRQRRKYKVPPKARLRDADPRFVIIRELSGSEIEQATKIAKSRDGATMGTEVAKLALDAIGRNKTSAQMEKVEHDGEHEILWDSFSNKVRTMIILAANKLNSSTDEEDADFFGSEEVV